MKQTSLKGIFVGYCESMTQYQVNISSKPGVVLGLSSTDPGLKGDFLNNPAISPSQSPTVRILLTRLDASGSDVDVSVTSFRFGFSRGVEDTTFNSLEEPSEQAEDLENSTELLESQAVPDIPVYLATKAGSYIRRMRDLHTKEISDARKGPDKEKWQTAIDKELKSSKSKEVFIPVIHVPYGRKIIGFPLVFAIKSDGIFKARLVAQGFSQVMESIILTLIYKPYG
ncbi:hypothetical protein K3495_g13449 [Podosphaera aphanis]|nr:hypothetical protein K3495_g13449 [Podosphaera aphanis]